MRSSADHQRVRARQSSTHDPEDEGQDGRSQPQVERPREEYYCRPEWYDGLFFSGPVAVFPCECVVM